MSSTLIVYVKDSITKGPVSVAEVSVSIGDQKIGVGHTDRQEGSFTKSIDPQYVGQPLTCRVSKDGYAPQEVTGNVHEEETKIEVELVLETFEFKFTVMDEEGRPLDGVGVIVEAGGKAVGSCFSDENGLARFKLNPGLANKQLSFKAELAGFEIAEGKVLIEKTTYHEVLLKQQVAGVDRSIRPATKRKRDIFGAIVTFVVGLVLTISIGFMVGWAVQQAKGIEYLDSFFAYSFCLAGLLLTIYLARKVWKGGKYRGDDHNASI